MFAALDGLAISATASKPSCDASAKENKPRLVSLVFSVSKALSIGRCKDTAFCASGHTRNHARLRQVRTTLPCKARWRTSERESVRSPPQDCGAVRAHMSAAGLLSNRSVG